MCVCVREREKERDGEMERLRTVGCGSCTVAELAGACLRVTVVRPVARVVSRLPSAVLDEV